MEHTERINTSKYALLLGDEVKKTFAIFEPGTQFNQAGFTSSKHGFLGWTGMILNAKLEGLPDGEVITEGKMKGKIGISIPDVETFERVVSRLRAFQAENPRQERGERGERTGGPKPIDPRTQLANRLRKVTLELKDDQAKAEANGWGVDFSKFQKTLAGITADAKSFVGALTMTPEVAEGIAKLQHRLDVLKAEVLAFGPEILQDRIAAAEHSLEQLKGSISANDYSGLRTRLDEVIEKAKAGDERGARALLYGDDGLFAAMGRHRTVADGENAEPEYRRGGRGQGSDRPYFEKGSPQGEAARKRAAQRYEQPSQRDSRR